MTYKNLDNYDYLLEELNMVMTSREVANACSVTISTVRRWIDEGKIVARQCEFSHIWLIARHSVYIPPTPA